MPRSYFRTLPDLYERKAFGTSSHPPYPPAALACFVGVLCFGEQQPERGRFKSRRLLAVLLEGPRGEGRAMARQIAFLIEQGDLIEQADGSLYIEGWDELQEGNWQVVERMSRYRARLRAVTPVVTDGVTPYVTVGSVTPPSRVEAVSGKRLAVSGKRGTADKPHTPRQAVHGWLADHGASPPVGWVNTTLNELVRVYGAEPILTLWTSAPSDVRTSKHFVQYAERSLAPAIHANGTKSKGLGPTAEEAESAFR